MDSASIEVNRRNRWAKTHRIDGEHRPVKLMRYHTLERGRTKPLRRKVGDYRAMNTPWTPIVSSVLGMLLGVLLAGCTPTRTLGPEHRPATWATPVAVDGLANLHRVDTNLFRSRQPDAAELQAAREQLGVRTIINLRAFHSDRKLAEQAGVNSVDLGLVPWDIDDEKVVSVLRTLRRREDGPFLLHCLYGANRTGLITAMYRMVEQGWTREEAINEMLHGGYGFNVIWFNMVDYLKSVDIERVRARLERPAP